VVVMGAGAVQPRKGVDLFVAAAQRLRRALPQAPLLFLWVGDGFDPELDYAASIWIADQIQRSGLSDCLHIVEASAAYRSCLRRADLFWLTSRLDPMPNVAIDALLCGTPVLCFAEASGTATWLQSDPAIGASCVANYLDTEHLAALSAALIDQPQQRAALSQRVQERANQAFRMEDYAKQLAAWLQEAEHNLQQQQHDCALLRAGDHLNTSFFLSPAIDPGEEPLVPYLMAWANRMHQRKPRPGFHPGVYATHHLELHGDPYAAFVQHGQPAGPWLTPVIEPGATGQPAQLSVGLHLHVHYPELLDGLLQQLRCNQIRPDLWISLSDARARPQVEQCLERAELQCEALLVCPNRGRDLGPLLVEFGQELDQRYAIHGHLHTKKSVLVDQAFAGRWRTFLQGNLLGQPGVPMLDAIAAAMEANPQLGLVYPDDPNVVGWGENKPIAAQLLSRLGLSANLADHLNFPVGSMFWARQGALSRLYQANWSYTDFPEEPIGYDGTLLHAIERLLPVINTSAGYSEALTHVPGLSR